MFQIDDRVKIKHDPDLPSLPTKIGIVKGFYKDLLEVRIEGELWLIETSRLEKIL